MDYIGDDDDDDYVYGNEQQFLDEYNVHGRVGFMRTDKTVQDIAADAGVTIQHGHLKDALQRFYVYVNASANRLINEGIIPWVSLNKIQLILTRIKDVKNPEFKNADAFVLGYAVTMGGSSIDVKHFDSLKGKIEKLDQPLQQTDVMRYANMWLSMTQ